MAHQITRFFASSLLVCVFSFVGCSGGGSDNSKDTALQEDSTTSLDLVSEISNDISSSPDVQMVNDAQLDAQGPDSPFPLEALDEPVPLKVGTANRQMPVPLGIPICGNAPPNKPLSPYSVTFPGSSFVYLHPTIRAVALEGGTSRLLIIRADLIAVNASVVERLENDLSELTGYDWTGKIIINASHTHSSAGRMGSGLIWEIMADAFFPELFERMTADLVDLAAEALLDMEPGAMGYGTVETADLHNDRRCENPELSDDRVHLLRFDSEDGIPKALIMVHSVHGTIIGAGQQNLSRDATGGIEEKVKESFDSYVEVLFLQAGAGDQSPDSPTYEVQQPAADIGGDYNRIESLGLTAAEVVQSVFWELETTTDVPISSVSHFVPLGRDVLGYEGDEFPYPSGGVYCGTTVDTECWSGEPTPVEGLDKMCLDIGISGDSAPDRTIMTAAQLGDVLIVTFPGEPVTQCLLNVEEGVRDMFPEQERIVVLGYSQDYMGYSTPEWDWWQGAYESSGALWGPKQGDYLTEAGIEIAASLLEPASSVTFEDPGPFELIYGIPATFTPTQAKGAGNIVLQPQSAAAGDIVSVEFTGGDAWHLMPIVILEIEGEDGQFKPLLRNNKTPVDSMGYEFFTTMTMDPTYKYNSSIKTRIFTWRVEMPTARAVPAHHMPLAGTYRFNIKGEYLDVSSKELADYDLHTEPFTVSP